MARMSNTIAGQPLSRITRVNHTVIGHLREIFSFLRSRRRGSFWKGIWNIFLEYLFIL